MHIGIIHFAAPPIVGGVELTMFHHARILTALEHQVTIAAGLGDAVLPQAAYRQVPLFGSRSPAVMEAGRALAKGQIPPDFNALVAQTRQALLDCFGHCDVVIGHNLFTLHKNLILTSAVYELARDSEGPPWVAWHHDFAWLRSQYQPELHPGEPWELLKRPWPGVQHVTVSHAQQAELAKLYGISLDDIIVVSPGVDPVEFYRCDSTVAGLLNEWDLFGADCIFLLPARITRRKNIELGLQWLAAIRARSDWDARLIVTGPPGPHNPTNTTYLEQLLALREQLQLQDAAHFVYQVRQAGDVPLFLLDEDLANLYQIVDAVFFPAAKRGLVFLFWKLAWRGCQFLPQTCPPFARALGRTPISLPRTFPPKTWPIPSSPPYRLIGRFNSAVGC